MGLASKESFGSMYSPHQTVASTKNERVVKKGRKISFKKSPNINPSTNLIYDLKVDNKKLRTENENMKERLSDMMQTLKMNKEMLKDVIDK